MSDKPEYVEFKIHNNREDGPKNEIKWGDSKVPSLNERKTSMSDLNSILADTYKDMFTNMIRNESIWFARMHDYKRARNIRRKWKFRTDTKLGRLLKKLGYWHLVDYVAFMAGIAKEAWSIENYEYYRLSDD